MMIKKRILIAIICALTVLAGSLSSCGMLGGGAKSEGSRNKSGSSKEIISDAEAMDLVLSRVPGADAEDFTRFEKELDDGHWIYHGELLYQGIEYKFEIEACDGNILEWTLDN